MKIGASFLFWKKKWQVLTLNIVHFPNFEMSATPHARALITGNTVFENKSDKTLKVKREINQVKSEIKKSFMKM